MIAALFVETGGVYFAPGFDPWDEARDRPCADNTGATLVITACLVKTYRGGDG